MNACQLISVLERECKRTFHGEEYMGQVNQTKSGASCQPWQAISGYEITMPVGSLVDNSNYCRYPTFVPSSEDDVNLLPNGPWCFNESLMVEACDIPFCGMF